jgi:hypothetical protein
MLKYQKVFILVVWEKSKKLSLLLLNIIFFKIFPEKCNEILFLYK